MYKESKMKYLLLVVLLLPLNSYGLDVNCEEKAAELVASLIDAGLTISSDKNITKEAMTFCESVVNSVDEARAEEANTEFSEWLINGKSADKAGNKRLKRLK
jgi:hypothetical protein